MKMGSDVGMRAGLRRVHEDVGLFSEVTMPGHGMRGYQVRLARAVCASVMTGAGEQFVGMFSRQAGKDEALAQVLAFLLSRYRLHGGSVVVAMPSLQPQGAIARDRLLERLSGPLTRGAARVREGRIIELGKARVHFLSAAPYANSRGNTASLLLVANEAQGIRPDVWEAVFAPMGASGNATTLFLGTAWTSDTLLAQKLTRLAELEREDGRKRVFKVDWREVAAELPEYGAYVQRQIAEYGEHHPFIRTEYELEELDGEGKLFSRERLEMLRGDFPAMPGPRADDGPGVSYALTVDVGGEVEDGLEGEALRRRDPQRDWTVATVVRVSTGDVLPRYEVVWRYAWTGTLHSRLREDVARLARDVWKAKRVVIDATGLGVGLASFLRAELGERVVRPFVFSSKSKSGLAWDFLGLLDGGRVKMLDPALGEYDAIQMRLSDFCWRQLRECRYTVLRGPGRLIRWGVEDARTHDDVLVSLMLIAELDKVDWRPRVARGG